MRHVLAVLLSTCLALLLLPATAAAQAIPGFPSKEASAACNSGKAACFETCPATGKDRMPCRTNCVTQSNLCIAEANRKEDQQRLRAREAARASDEAARQAERARKAEEAKEKRQAAEQARAEHNKRAAELRAKDRMLSQQPGMMCGPRSSTCKQSCWLPGQQGVKADPGCVRACDEQLQQCMAQANAEAASSGADVARFERYCGLRYGHLHDCKCLARQFTEQRRSLGPTVDEAVVQKAVLTSSQAAHACVRQDRLEHYAFEECERVRKAGDLRRKTRNPQICDCVRARAHSDFQRSAEAVIDATELLTPIHRLIDACAASGG